MNSDLRHRNESHDDAESGAGENASGGSADARRDELPESRDEPSVSRDRPSGPRRWRSSLRQFLGLTTIAMLVLALVMTSRRLAKVESELVRLRAEVGHLEESAPGQIAAVRIPSDEPLTYRFRVRVPDSPPYRVAYSSVLPTDSRTPQWYGAVKVPPGESQVTVRIASDPRDDRWKITTLVGSTGGTRRMATVLPPPQVRLFRGSHDVISVGLGRKTLAADANDSIRLLDQRWVDGEGSLLLYGDRPARRDQPGVYAELQPDDGPL